MHVSTLNRSLFRGACLLLPAALLTACGGHKQIAKQDPPVTDKVVEIRIPELDGRGSYRFLMSDGDKRMSADEFDAWMQRNGLLSLATAATSLGMTRRMMFSALAQLRFCDESQKSKKRTYLA